jgi:poly-beta-1,6-N-acetyl-D-glucosamine synthase
VRSGPIADVLIAFVGLYPLVMAARWIAGGLLFRALDERNRADPPAGGWPGVTILIPAYDEGLVIGASVKAALAVDYPDFEVMVLDDGSTDATVEEARRAGGDDPRLRVVPDPQNRGKAERLNRGFQLASNDLVVVTDADTHLHPAAIKFLVTRIEQSPRIAAVAGGPHVTNRGTLLGSLQILEDASIIGLIRRTQALSGHVGTVAGVLGMFRRPAVLEVGGYNGRMATEDIELSWRLLLGGWDTAFEPNALVGMEVPLSLRTLWAQRSRWARGQGEVLRTHWRIVLRWKNRSLWPLVVETAASLAWVLAAALAMVAVVVVAVTGDHITVLDHGLAWGIALSVIAMLQVVTAIALDVRYDRAAAASLLVGPLYPAAYWALNACAAVRAETPALIHGPRGSRVVWDIPREGPEG